MKKILALCSILAMTMLSSTAGAMTPKAAEEPSATVLSTDGAAPKVVAKKKHAKHAAAKPAKAKKAHKKARKH